MDEDINDVMDIFQTLREHEFNEIQNDLNGLVARQRAMEDAVEGLERLEDDIQGKDWAFLPESDDERLKRENLLINVLKLVDDGYLSSVWGLRESLRFMKEEYAPNSSEIEGLYDEYQTESRLVLGLRIYSHHGNSLPITIREEAVGEYIGDGEGIRRKIGVPVDDVWEKKGQDYYQDGEYHYGHYEDDFIHLLVVMESHLQTVDGLIDDFVAEILRANSQTVEDYQEIGSQFRSLLDEGAHNQY